MMKPINLNGLLNILHLSRYANHPEFKSVLNTIFLTFSCLLIVSSYTAGINNWFAKIGSIIVLVVLDIAIQWVLGLSKAYWKLEYVSHKKISINWNKVKAGVLLFFWLLYVLVYAVPTAVGFFMNNLSVQNETIQQVSDNYQLYKDEYDQNKIAIDNLNASSATESKTGYRKYSIAATDEYKRLQDRQTKLRKLLPNLSEEKIKVAQTSDQTMKTIAKTLGLTEQLLTLIAYSCTVLMIYVFLFLTAWDVQINKTILNSNIDDFKKDVLTWLDAAFDNRPNGSLNGIGTIAEKTGFSEDKCKDIRTYLSELKVNGDYAVNVSIGATKANYDKNFIRTYILNH